MATALCPVPLPDHVRLGTDPADILESIRDPAVTLAIWERPTLFRIRSLEGFATFRFTADVEDVRQCLTTMLADQIAQDWHAALVADAADLARRYAKIMRLSRVEMRVERVTGNACWRFHADYVTVRLITTYAGPGTQWLDRETAVSLKAGDVPPYHQLATGAVGLFKGRLLAPDTPIVHRSPPIDGTGADRLLLVIDPDRTDGRA